MNTIEKQTETQAQIEMAKRHLDLVYGGVSERKYGYLWIKRGDEKATYPFAVNNAEERAEMARKAIEFSDTGFDIYYSVELSGLPSKTVSNFVHVDERNTMQSTIARAVVMADTLPADLISACHNLIYRLETFDDETEEFLRNCAALGQKNNPADIAKRRALC